MKDYFSGHSKQYAAFRPTYPDELYRFIFGHLKTFDAAWDCATGNGQVARVLATQFENVFATDISRQQLEHAYKADNIVYSVQPAEKTDLPDKTFDLITVAQALHWIDANAFYSEVIRTAKPGAWLAVWGYSHCTVNPEVDFHFLKFYNETVGPYWDGARKLVEDHYRSIPFPFDEVKSPAFSIKASWTAKEFAGYLGTWSATQKFIKEKGYDPVPEVMEKISPLWKDKLPVTFPVFLRMGEIV
ncbi:MAG: methyltransferase domain-containing protein [Flammeovirgaceae bacterium]|nr:MAG: methyltransferase domain-containing protein [Flammeovirgaceae bacterium]